MLLKLVCHDKILTFKIGEVLNNLISREYKLSNNHILLEDPINTELNAQNTLMQRKECLGESFSSRKERMFLLKLGAAICSVRYRNYTVVSPMHARAFIIVNFTHENQLSRS